MPSPGVIFDWDSTQSGPLLSQISHSGLADTCHYGSASLRGTLFGVRYSNFPLSYRDRSGPKLARGKRRKEMAKDALN